MRDIHSICCVGALLQVPHLDLFFCIPNLLLHLGGHKKAHITKISIVFKNLEPSYQPQGGGGNLDTLNFRVCHRDQSSNKRLVF